MRGELVEGMMMVAAVLTAAVLMAYAYSWTVRQAFAAAEAAIAVQ